MARYENLKDYIALKKLDVISYELNRYLKDNSNTSNCVLCKEDGINIHTLAWNSFDSETLSKRYIRFTIGISASLTNYNTSHTQLHYYNITMCGNLRKQLSDLKVISINEVPESLLQKETVLSLFGLPTNISTETLEETAEKFYAAYCPEELIDKTRRYSLPVVSIKNSIGCKMWYADLPDNCLGKIYLNPSSADIYDTTTSLVPVRYPQEPVPFGTILLNYSYYRIGDRTDDIIVSAHEFIHWHFHQPFMEIMFLLDNECKTIDCSAEPLLPEDSMSASVKAYWYAEWQANELSIRVAMPKHLVEEAVDEYNSDKSVHNPSDIPFSGDYYQNMIWKLSWDFNVPHIVMKKRFRQLGYDYADGTFVQVDDCLYPPFTFPQGTLKDNETFVIDRANYERLLLEDKEFAELIKNRFYVYTGCVICANDAKYVSPVSSHSGLIFSLSDYAREHADECCLKLILHEKQSATTYTEFDCLCKLDDRTYSKDGKLTQEAENDWNSYKKMKEDKKEAQRILVEMEQKKVISLKDALRFHLERLKLQRNDIYDEFYLNGNTFKSYIDRGSEPSLNIALILCNKLSLPYDLSIDLLKRAHITLNTADAYDEMCDYLLTITNASLDEWELFLKKNGFPPLVDHTK